MTNISSSIHSLHINRQIYFLDENNEPKVGTTKLETAEKLLDLAEKSVDAEERKILEACAYDYLRGMEKKGAEGEEFDKALSRALLLVLGKPSDEVVDRKSDWYKLITGNSVHYMAHRQDFTCAYTQIRVNGELLDITTLEKRESGSGYTFHKKGNDDVLFYTNKDLKLRGYFWAGQKGILPGSSTTTTTLGEFFKREPTGRYWVSAYSVAKSLENYSFGTSHSYLGLEDSDGNVSYVGQFGPQNDTTLLDYFTPLGPKKLGIETPDRYSSSPLAQNHIKEAKIEITKEQYDLLHATTLKELQEGTDGSLIRGNCSGFVRKKLKMIGVQAKTTTTVQRVLFAEACRILLPKSLHTRLIKWIKKMPDWFANIMCFFPLIYIPTLLLVGVSQVLSGRRDTSLSNAIFKPWKLEIDHPIALFEWLDQCAEEEKGKIVLECNVDDSTEIGKQMRKTMQELGYTHNERAKLSLAKVEPIPQPYSMKRPIDYQTSLLHLHTLKNQRFISPYQFHKLKERVGQKAAFQNEVSRIVTQNHDKGLIDRRSYIHIKHLLQNDKLQDALQHLLMISLIHQINTTKHSATLQNLITPKIQVEMERTFSEYSKDFHFSETGIRFFQEFFARIQCYEWAEKVDNPTVKRKLLEAISSNDASSFSKALREVFQKEPLLYEMENPFIRFSYSMQTEQDIVDLEKNLDELYARIKGTKKSIDDKTIATLREMHRNIGVSLECDAPYTGSGAIFDSHLTVLQEKWKKIEGLLGVDITPASLWPNRANQSEQQPSFPGFESATTPDAGLEQNVARLLFFSRKLPQETALTSLEQALQAKGPYLKFNAENSTFEPSDSFLIDDAKIALSLIKGRKKIDPDTLKLFIQMMLQSEKEVENLMGELAQIDCYRVKLLPLKKVYTLEQAESLYLVPKAKENLRKWVELKTSNGRSPKNQNAKAYAMLPKQEAMQIFLRRPEEVQFVKELHLHRKASTFEHKFRVRRGHLQIVFHGRYTNVSSLMNRFMYVNNRIITIDDQQEYNYTYDKGLSPIQKGENPITWNNEIPLFKRKIRKTKDYRLELVTTIGKEYHGWLRLKDKDGNVYSVGRIWDPDYQLGKENIARALPGVVRGQGDIQEFLGLESDWKKTRLQITEELFNKLKKRIIQIQEDKSYNVVNHNCVSLVDEILRELGFLQKSNSPAMFDFIPASNNVKKYIYLHNNIRRLFHIASYPVALICNLVLAKKGMLVREDVSCTSQAGMRNRWQLLCHEKSLIDQPSQLRLVQEILEEDSMEFSSEGKIAWDEFRRHKRSYLVSQVANLTT